MAYHNRLPRLIIRKRTLSRDEYLCRASEFAMTKRKFQGVRGISANVRLLRADENSAGEIMAELAGTKRLSSRPNRLAYQSV